MPKVTLELSPDAVRLLARRVDYQASRETNTWGWDRWEAASTELRLVSLQALAEVNRTEEAEAAYSEIVRVLEPGRDGAV